jgi:mono/diheme cytochrome c family protein
MKQRLRRSVPLILLPLLGLVAACTDREAEQGAAGAPKLQSARELPPGEALFNERCRDCHRVHEKGGIAGPDLSTIGSRREKAYPRRVIREPSRIFPGTIMPTHDAFSFDQVDSLVDYLSSLK